MRIDQDIKLDYEDVLIRPKRSTLSSRKEVDLEREFKFPFGAKPWRGIPIMPANMDNVGTIAMSQVLAKFKMPTALHKYYDNNRYQEIDQEYTFITTGVRDDDLEKLNTLKTELGDIRLICIDAANGYTEKFIETIKKVRDSHQNSVIMAGNVATGEITEQLILAGADIVKIGIGPGSACTTRKMTGVGYPQLSAVIECADAAHGLKGLVCADGGCKVPADIAKAFGAGADFVMSGSLFNGHTESETEIIEKDGQKYLPYYGSSSNKAMEEHSGGKASYRASEGRELLVPYKGDVADTVEEILGSLRSTCTYVGAQRLKELSKRTTFIKVSRQLNRIYEQFESESLT